MTLLDKITEKVLAQIDDTGFTQSGAFNLRHNGIALCHGDSEHIKIKKKQDKPGIDIFIDGKTDGEEVHIPVVVDASGMTDVVYNDFYVAEGANVTIVAGCGIHNSGCNESRHDGIHTFHVEKNANVRYVEKHYGEGEGTGARVLNPVTEVYLVITNWYTLICRKMPYGYLRWILLRSKESILRFVKIMYIWKPVPSFMSLKN